MKRFWTAMAVTLLAIPVVGGCNDYGNTFQNPTGAFLSFLSPSQVSAGSPDFTLTLSGNGFVAQTKVQWNGKNLQTTVPTDSSGNVLGNVVTAVVPAAMIAKPGMTTVNTINPASGTGNNGLSNTINFIINNPPNPVPTVTSVSPACAVTGSDLALTVTGTNFLNSSTDTTQISTLNWTLGGSQVQVTAPAATITSTQITATIKGATISSTGNATVTVSNPPSPPVPNVPGSAGSGGGTSAVSSATTVTVQSTLCPTAAKSPGNSIATAVIAEETPAVSLDGRYVAYTAVQDEHAQIFLRDTCEGAPAGCQAHTSLLSVTSDANPASGDSHTPSMSSDGRYVAFSSDAASLVENAPPGRQIYLRDTCAGADDSCKPSTLLVSMDSGGALVGAESILPSVSSSGRFVAFQSVSLSHSSGHSSTDAKSSTGATNSGYRQVFVRDTCLGAANCTPKTTRISLQPGDGTGTDAKPAGPAISGKGKQVALAGAKALTLFTHSVAVDDSFFLAITGDQR
jgi:IPT/TIG domain-containing protein/WD40 repeat protein